MVELRLDSVDELNLPQDCFVSVRIGEAQKLSKLSNSRIYRFPKVGDRRVGKIEVFRRIGSCNVDVNPSNKELREVSIKCDEAGFGSLGLKVAVTGEVKVEADPTEIKKDGHKVKAAKDYLSKHGLEVRLSEAMQAVLRERPSDPAEFLASKLMEPCDRIGGVKVAQPKGAQEESSKAGAPAKKPANVLLKSSDLAELQQPPAPAAKAAPAPLPKNIHKDNSGLAGEDVSSKCYSKLPTKAPEPAAQQPAAPAAAAAGKVAAYFKPSVGTWLARAPSAPKVLASGTPAPSAATAKPAAVAFQLKPSVSTWLAPRRPASKEQKAEARTEEAAGLKTEARTEGAADFKRLPSVGTWLAPLPRAAPEAAVGVAKADAAKTEVVAFRKLPSVGTWLAPLPSPSKPAVVPAEAPAEAEAKAEARAFQKLPSVSTWLAPRPRVSEPAVGTPKAEAKSEPKESAKKTWVHKPSIGTWLVQPLPAPSVPEQKTCFAKRPSVVTWLAARPQLI